MIASEILNRLVPDRLPDGRFPGRLAVDAIREEPARRIGLWSDYLRSQLQEAAQSGQLAEIINQAGLVGTGIFRVSDPHAIQASPEFPNVYGFQFGVALFAATRLGDVKEPYIALEGGTLRAPLMQTIAALNLHGSQPDGYVAAVYEELDGTTCGITAGHVVNRCQRGQVVPVACSDCGDSAHLVRRAPGLIDAAKVQFPCGGPAGWQQTGSYVRNAVEGETVILHLGNSGKMQATVMMSLSSPSEIRSAATPRHFLTDQHGYYGDSGSLVASAHHDGAGPHLIGLYLGDTVCEEPNGATVTYGYGLDLNQAAYVLGAKDLKGVFND